MKQEITCQKGRCYEEESIEAELDSLYDSTNIVQEIQKEMIKQQIR